MAPQVYISVYEIKVESRILYVQLAYRIYGSRVRKHSHHPPQSLSPLSQLCAFLTVISYHTCSCMAFFVLMYVRFVAGRSYASLTPYNLYKVYDVPIRRAMLLLVVCPFFFLPLTILCPSSPQAMTSQDLYSCNLSEALPGRGRSNRGPRYASPLAMLVESQLLESRSCLPIRPNEEFFARN